MSQLRQDNSSPYQKYGGQLWKTDKVTVKLGSRDSAKTHGHVTEDFIKKVLPILGFAEGEDFVVDQLDGTSKFAENLDLLPDQKLRDE